MVELFETGFLFWEFRNILYCMSASGGEGTFVASRIERILQTSIWNQDAGAVVDELYEFVCKDPLPVSACSSFECIVATEEDTLAEIFREMLGQRWKHPSTVLRCGDVGKAIRMVRDRQPGVLAITTNLLILPGWKVIAACAAVSPGTRYLILTGWYQPEVAKMRASLSRLRVRVDILSLPFSREQLVSAFNNIVL